MPGVRVKEGESFERALRRFKKQCERAGILGEVRKREYYEKPSVKAKKKAAAARKRLIKWGALCQRVRRTDVRPSLTLG